MVRQRFRVLFRRWFFTVAKVCVPILLFEVYALGRQHLQYAALGIFDLLVAAFVAFLLTAVLCWLWALGEWLWYRLRRLPGFSSERQPCSGRYGKPEAVRTSKA